MRIVIIQHELDTPAGSTLEWLQQNRLKYQIFLAPQTLAYPSLSDFDSVIVLGGSMNVDEEEKHPWLAAEKVFLHSCLQAKKKILGLCLGSQLLAEALGAKVQSMNNWEIGWFAVQAGKTRFPAFHFHQYSFNIPNYCISIASSDACANQGFSYQDNVLAFQFHPEADAAWIDLALKDWNPQLSGAVQSLEDILRDSSKNLPLTRQWYFQQLQSFFSTASNQ